MTSVFEHEPLRARQRLEEPPIGGFDNDHDLFALVTHSRQPVLHPVFGPLLGNRGRGEDRVDPVDSKRSPRFARGAIGPNVGVAVQHLHLTRLDGSSVRLVAHPRGVFNLDL